MEEIMNYNIRELKPSEYSLLKDFTYHAIFQRDPNNLLSKDILNNPELEVFYEDFGKPDDFGLIATHENQAIGAVWARILDGPVKGFGHIDNKTPELQFQSCLNIEATKLVQGLCIV